VKRRKRLKSTSLYLFRYVIVIAVFFMLIGCSYTMKISDLPQLQIGSPLKSISSKTFAFKEFKDTRVGDNPLVMLNVHGDKLTLEQPPAIMVATAIKRELERNGHVCVMDLPQTKSDFIIEGTVYRCWLREDRDLFKGKITGDVAVKLTICSVSDEKKVLTKNYAGEYYLSSGFGIPSSSWMAILNEALLEMIKEISTDPELIGFIEK
jgi:uncharacterized lipoprotein YajG